MSYRTTAILLAVLVALGAYVYFFGSEPKETQTVPDESLQVLNFDEESVDSLEMREAGSVVLVKKNAGGMWELVKPEQFEGDQYRVETVVYYLAKLAASRIVTASPDDLATYGLSKPVMEVVVGAKGVDPVQVSIGSQNPANTGNYLKRSGSDTVYLVDSYGVTQIRGLITDPPKAKPTPSPVPVVTATSTPVPGAG